MELNAQRTSCLLFALFVNVVVLFSSSCIGAPFVGVVYGTQGDNLPTPDQVAELLRANSITQVRIYDSNPDIMKAFANSSIQLLVGVTNDELGDIGQSNVTAANWVRANILPYVPWTNITGIAVGNEVLTVAGNSSAILVPAMRYIHASLVSFGLDSQIKVTTPHSIGVLDISFPPSQGAFNSSLLPVIVPMLNFLSLTGSYVMLNVFPYYAYQANSQAISLSYALFEPNSGVLDSYSNLRYFSLYDALLDAGYAAMKSLNFSGLLIVVGETGWPSAGDAYEIGATPANASLYNGNLVKRVFNRTGTPFRPNDGSSVYLYELYNEDLRIGSTSERNWGLFAANQTPMYVIDLSGAGHGVVGNSTNQTWCIAKLGISDSNLQRALDYACGEGGANCSAIQPGGVCWNPDTIQSHASFAFNAYYQKMGEDSSTCDFKGLAQLTSIDPSYGSCLFFQNSTVAPSDFSSATVTAGFYGSTYISFVLMMVVTVQYIIL